MNTQATQRRYVVYVDALAGRHCKYQVRDRNTGEIVFAGHSNVMAAKKVREWNTKVST